MKHFISIFLVLCIFTATGQHDYDFKKRHNDSVFIYNQYRTHLYELQHLRKTDIAAWRIKQAIADSLTACAKTRLSQYNHESYRPHQKHDRPDYGEAYVYPNPNNVSLDTFFKNLSPEKIVRGQLFFVVYDTQTYFADKNGVKIPFIKKLSFEGSQFPRIEKLDPVTYVALDF